MGRAFVFGDHIDTDLILPGCYLNVSEPGELAKVCMSGLEEGFAARIRPGDVFVAGQNFGCGSSREHAPISIKAAGVSFVIAESFARIFYRNAINIGLLVIELKEATRLVGEGDEVSVDFRQGTVRNLTREKTYTFRPFPPFIMEIINVGGMVDYVRKRRSS